MTNGEAAVVSCVVDTDVVIDCLRRRSHARELLERWSVRGVPAVSAVTHVEVYRGLRAGEEAATEEFLDGVVTIAVDVPLARRAGLLLREIRSRGLTVGVADAIVAATALALDVPLLTNNARHYRLPGLRTVSGIDG